MKARLIASSAFLAVLGISSQLHAADTFYPGTLCRYYDPLGNDTVFDPGGQSANALKNVSAGNYYVTCPITKPLSSRTRGAWIVIDDNSTDCKLYRRSANGSSVNSLPTSVVPSGSQYLYRWDFGAAGWDSEDDTVSIYCRIDAGKIVGQYFHQEL